MAKRAVGIIIACLLIFLFNPSIAEEKKIPEEISTEKFVEIYVDLSIVAEKFLNDSTKLAQSQDSIFLAHKTSREQFDNFRKKMDAEPENWTQVWEKIVKKLEELDREANKPKQQNPPQKTDK